MGSSQRYTSREQANGLPRAAQKERMMAAEGSVQDRVVENPVIGDRVTFLRTTAETNGEYLLQRMELAPHGGNTMHYHLAFTEEFTVLEGELHVSLNGEERVLQAGERVLVPIRAPHRFYSTSDSPVVFTNEIRPARQMERATRIVYGLARDGKVNSQSIPRNIWQMALIFEMGESYLVGMPLFLQRAIFGTLARIARWRGVERSFEKYV